MTPGARTLAYVVLQEAMNGRPGILRSRRDGAVDALCQAAASDFPCSIEIIAGRVDIEPKQELAQLASPGASSGARAGLTELIANEGLRDTMVLACVGADCLPHWVTFAGLFASARKAFEGPAAGLILITDERCATPAGCRQWDDDAIIDPIDAMVFIRDQTHWPHSRLVEAATAVLVETCRGDLDLIDRFLDLDPQKAFNPMAVFGTLPPSPEQKPLFWRGRDEPCPLWLLGKNPSGLSQRIWRGQLSILFPWLEEVRTQIVSIGARSFSRAKVCDDAGRTIKPEDFEFVHIALALRSMGVAQTLVNAAHTLRLTRNELAHCRPIGVADLKAAERAATELTERWTG